MLLHADGVPCYRKNDNGRNLLDAQQLVPAPRLLTWPFSGQFVGGSAERSGSIPEPEEDRANIPEEIGVIRSVLRKRFNHLNYN